MNMGRVMSSNVITQWLPSWVCIGLCIVSFEVAASTDSQSTDAHQDAAVVPCYVSPLLPVPDTVKEFEKDPKHPPEFALRDISEELRDLVERLTQDMAAKGIKVRQTSGYRPKDYQQHFYDVSRKWRALKKAYTYDKRQRRACASIQAVVDHEIDKHDLKTAPGERRTKKGDVSVFKGQPLVSPPGLSNHEARPAALAVDLDATPSSPLFLKQAKELGLTQPCPKDTVHFSAGLVKCTWTAEITGNSLIRLWLIDPIGRRLGFDPVSGQEVNEIGEGAQQSRADDLETLVVGAAMPGDYRVGGIGTGTGPYKISLVAFNEAGQIRAAAAWSGTTAEGVPLPPHRIDLFPRPGPQPAVAEAAAANGANPQPPSGPSADPPGNSSASSRSSSPNNSSPAGRRTDTSDDVQWPTIAIVSGGAVAMVALAGFLQLRRRRRAERF
jgi:hypothetical protein